MLLQLNIPGSHAQLSERMTQTVAARVRSTLAALPYILPCDFTPYADRAVCHAINNSIHDRIAPLTPHELVRGTKLASIPKPFGRSYMIATSEDKRRREARALDTNWKTLPKVELGVVMGPDTHTDGTLFLTANNKVVSRSNKRLRALPRSFVPYSWRPRPYFPSVRLPLPPRQALHHHILPPPTHPTFTTPVLHPTPHSAALFATPTGAQLNKQRAQKDATVRNRQYRLSLPVSTVSNAPTSIQPTPPPPQPRSEVACKVALQRWSHAACYEAEATQLNKIINTYGSFRPITPSQIEPNHIFLRSMSLFKEKVGTGEINCRIPVDGSRQPAHTYGELSAATSDSTTRQFILSCCLKHQSDTGRTFKTASGDIPAAFINNNPLPRSSTGGTQFITRLPKDLLHREMANQLCTIDMAHYGTKNANHIFDHDLATLLTSHGY